MPELVSQRVRVGAYSVATTTTAGGGDGGLSPPVVFIHGWAGTRALWNQTLLALASERGDAQGAGTNWHPVAIDMPGFGGSGPPPTDLSPAGLARVLLQILAELRPDGVVLVGHSLGALVALEAARQATGHAVAGSPATTPVSSDAGVAGAVPLIRGLVLVSPPDPADLRIRTALFRTRLLGMPVAASFQAVGLIAARGHVPTGRGRAARWIRRRAQSVGTPTDVLYKVAHELAHARSPVPLSGTIPVLVVIGDSDHTVSADAGRRLAGAAAASELVVLPRAGHHVMEAQPELFTAALIDWLARTIGTG